MNTNLKFLSTIFGRTIFTLLVVMLPLYGIGFQIYLSGLANFREEIALSNIAKVEFMVAHFEQEIRRIRTLQFALAHDRDLLDLVNKSEILSPYERDMLILRLIRTLYSVKNSSRYISDVVAYLRPVGLSISALGDVERLRPERLPNSPDDEAPYPWLSLAGEAPRINFGTDLPNDAVILGIEGVRIEVRLSREYLESSLDGFSDYRSCNAFLYDLKGAVLICGPRNKDRTQRIIHTIAERTRDAMIREEHYDSSGNEVAVFVKESDYLGFLIGKQFLVEEAFVKVGGYRAWFLVFSVLSLGVIVAAALSAYAYIHKPLSLLVGAFSRLEEGDFEVRVEHPPRDEFGFLYSGFNDMAMKLGSLIDQVYRQKILAQSSEMRQLQAQINPHFLYNSLFILSTLIKTGDNENAQSFALHLGQYFQYLTRGGSETVPLKEEYEHAFAYMSIQRARVGELAEISMDTIPEGYEDIGVPRLILQPLIENAFEHGVKNVRKGCAVRVTFSYTAGGNFLISIEDSGRGTTDEDIERMNGIIAGDHSGEESIGILNIHRRVRLRFGEKSGLSFKRSGLGGVRADLVIVIRGEQCTVS